MHKYADMYLFYQGI